jgi:hypothetical protein
VSVDGGETWSTPQRTSIPNPNSKMHTIRGTGVVAAGAGGAGAGAASSGAGAGAARLGASGAGAGGVGGGGRGGGGNSGDDGDGGGDEGGGGGARGVKSVDGAVKKSAGDGSGGGVGGGSSRGGDGGGRGGSGAGGVKGDPTPLLLAAYNHHPKLRAPLVLARSRDDGASWRSFAVVEPAVASLLQFSYPTMLAVGRGTSGGGAGEPYLFTAYSVMKSSRGSLTCYGIKVARVPMSGIPR